MSRVGYVSRLFPRFTEDHHVVSHLPEFRYLARIVAPEEAIPIAGNLPICRGLLLRFEEQQDAGLRCDGIDLFWAGLLNCVKSEVRQTNRCTCFFVPEKYFLDSKQIRPMLPDQTISDASSAPSRGSRCGTSRANAGKGTRTLERTAKPKMLRRIKRGDCSRGSCSCYARRNPTAAGRQSSS